MIPARTRETISLILARSRWLGIESVGRQRRPTVYFMNKISTKDQYGWLEKDSKKTKRWVLANEKPTISYLEKIHQKKELRKRFEKIMLTDSMSIPIQRKDLYFFRYRKAFKDQSSIYVKKELNGIPKLLIDPDKLKLGTISSWKVSKNARYIGINFSKSSNDRNIIKIFDVDKRKFLKDTIIDKRYPSFQRWNVKETGFWYVRGEPGHSLKDEKYYKRIYYHELGQNEKDDEIFFDNLEKNDWPSMSGSSDGKYQLVTIRNMKEKTKIFFRDTTSKKPKFINITKGIEALSSARVENDYIYLSTNYQAPNEKILRRKINDASLGEWQVFIPESKYKIESWIITKYGLLIEYIENISSKLYLIDFKSRKKRSIKLPELGALNAFNNESGSRELFFNFSSLNIPPSIYRLDLKNLKQKLYWMLDIKIPKLTIHQEYTYSKDGTRIPMFLLFKDKPKNSPILVNAYGGFGVSEMPNFRPSIIPFIEKGGCYVLANIRGGGEFGEKWHNAVKKKKQHKRFEDFSSVLKHLSDKKYTSPEKIAIWGGSNGGLLMSVMVLKYPNLFKAALISVPVTDMLRFHLFHGGRWWVREYGDPEDEKMRKYLLSYSPYHNVENKGYPSMMFVTGEHDDRVHPMHTFKMFARLKENKKQKNPLLLYVEKKAGHSGSAKVSATLVKWTDIYSFVFNELGMVSKS